MEDARGLTASPPPLNYFEDAGENEWRRRESNPRPKALAFPALHACPVLCRHPAGRTRAPSPPDHPLFISPGARGAESLASPLFWRDFPAPWAGLRRSRALSRFRRRARAQRCRWRLCRCPFFIEVRTSPACAERFVALVETGSPQ